MREADDTGPETPMSNQDEQVPPALLDVDGVAQYLGTTPRHIRRLISERRIPHHKVGAFVRFRISTIDRWLDENERAGRTPPPPSRTTPVRSTPRRRSAQTAPPPPLPGQLSLE